MDFLGGIGPHDFAFGVDLHYLFFVDVTANKRMACNSCVGMFFCIQVYLARISILAGIEAVPEAYREGVAIDGIAAAKDIPAVWRPLVWDWIAAPEAGFHESDEVAGTPKAPFAGEGPVTCHGGAFRSTRRAARR